MMLGVALLTSLVFGLAPALADHAAWISATC